MDSNENLIKQHGEIQKGKLLRQTTILYGIGPHPVLMPDLCVIHLPTREHWEHILEEGQN